MLSWLTGVLWVGVMMPATNPVQNADREVDSASSDGSEEPTSELSRFIAAHLPLTDHFEANRQSWTDGIPGELTTEDFHMARFLDDDEHVTINQLNEALEGCAPADRMNANDVSITIHYSCTRRERARLVYNFHDGRMERILVGDLPQKLRCGICVDEAEKR